MTTTTRWSARALHIGCIVLAACYSSSSQVKDGQSHWMEACEDELECAGDLACVDDVCTLATEQTMAIGVAPGALAVTDDAVFWEDLGRADRSGAHQRDGGVYRFDLASQQVTAVASSLHEPLPGLFVDDAYAYVADRSGILYFALDGSASGGASNPSGDIAAPWTVVSGSIYYARFRGQEIRRMTPATGEDSALVDVGAGLAVVALASDGERLLIEAHQISLPATALLAIDQDGASIDLVTNTFRITNTQGRIVASDGLVFSVEGNRTALRALELSTGTWSELGQIEEPAMALRSAGDAFVYYTLDAQGESDATRHSLLRSRLGSEPEVLHRSTDPIGDAVDKNGYVYWIEGTRISRKQL
jgi:hypothetical protein